MIRTKRREMEKAVVADMAAEMEKDRRQNEFA